MNSYNPNRETSYYDVPMENRKSKAGLILAVVSIVLGLLGIITSPSVVLTIMGLFTSDGGACFIIIISFAFAIAAVIFGIMGIKGGSKVGIAGIVLGCIGVLLIAAPMAYTFFAPM